MLIKMSVFMVWERKSALNYVYMWVVASTERYVTEFYMDVQSPKQRSTGVGDQDNILALDNILRLMYVIKNLQLFWNIFGLVSALSKS